MRSNGGIVNFQANNVNLSDARIKNIIGPTGSHLEALCQLEVVEFEYKDSPGRRVTGLIAQQVQSIMSDMVELGGATIIDDVEVPLLAVKTTDIYHRMLKAIQELKAENDGLKQRITLLETA